MEKLRHRGVRTVMLTGDSRPVAEAIGASLGMDDVRAELLPAEKVAAIEALQSQGRKVVMVASGLDVNHGLFCARVERKAT